MLLLIFVRNNEFKIKHIVSVEINSFTACMSGVVSLLVKTTNKNFIQTEFYRDQ